LKRRLPFYKRIAVLLVIAVLCIAMARFSSNFTGGILLNELLAPVQCGVMNAWQRVGGIYNTIAETQQIRNENDVLRDQVRELTLENTRLREYSLENKRLRELLDFKERYEEDYTLLGARIISRAPNAMSNTLVVDRGSQDGVKKNMVAVSHEGLVGKVVAVGPSTAEILLILDREGAAGASIQDTRTPGVVEGTEDGHGLLRMVSLPYDAQLRKGETVVTSGMGGIYPPGLPIGKITEIEDSGINMFALVEPFVDFSYLEEIFLITESKQQQ
jgi:rod shape-determining protein MreC